MKIEEVNDILGTNLGTLVRIGRVEADLGESTMIKSSRQDRGMGNNPKYIIKFKSSSTKPAVVRHNDLLKLAAACLYLHDKKLFEE